MSLSVLRYLWPLGAADRGWDQPKWLVCAGSFVFGFVCSLRVATDPWVAAYVSHPHFSVVRLAFVGRVGHRRAGRDVDLSAGVAGANQAPGPPLTLD